MTPSSSLGDGSGARRLPGKRGWAPCRARTPPATSRAGSPDAPTVKNPNAATRNVDWVHIIGMYLQANGASSKVLNLTSVGHADIENNRFVMGTGGGATEFSATRPPADFDSTNTLIKHNEFDPESSERPCACVSPASSTWS